MTIVTSKSFSFLSMNQYMSFNTLLKHLEINISKI